METIYDDMPHPIPPLAYLRYKENWFFLILDVENRIFGQTHFSYEPGLDRARMSCNLSVKGEIFKYGNAIPFPKQFAHHPEIGDDKLKLKFVEAHSRFGLQLNSDDAALDVSYTRRAPTFDYEASEAANPGVPTLAEVANLSTNQLCHHQQQALNLSGTLRMKSGAHAGKTFTLSGAGYRDHSRMVRCDNLTLRHIWSFHCFPDKVFGAMSMTNMLRPSVTHIAGYIHQDGKSSPLKNMEITNHNQPAGEMPQTVEFKLNDVAGKPYTIIADIANRYGYVPLSVEAGDAEGNVYICIENFCPLTIKETGEKGFGLVEVGYTHKR
jgi:hypothetical protein